MKTYNVDLGIATVKFRIAKEGFDYQVSPRINLRRRVKLYGNKKIAVLWLNDRLMIVSKEEMDRQKVVEYLYKNQRKIRDEILSRCLF